LTSTQLQQERRPFAWLSNLPELLAERAEQEIVYYDVSIRGGTTTEHQRDAAMTAMSSIGNYNDFVVQDVTVSNIVINAAAVNVSIADLVPHVDMGAGDWLDLSLGSCSCSHHYQTTTLQ
jgi:hypothetical protein